MTLSPVAARRAQKSMRLSLPSSRWSVAVATCLYMGHLPVAPRNVHLGSFGVSVITPFICWPLVLVLGPWGALMSALASTLIGTAALMDVEERGQPSDHDARAVVIDEWAGASVASMLLPFLFERFAAGFAVQALLCLVVGLTFRVCDITKPYPANVVDRAWHHPFSVILDDLIAGGYALLILLALATLALRVAA